MTGIKVLLIDDDSSLLEISKEFLELDRKIFTDIANSAEEALVSIKGNEYDVVVSDFDMPDKNGIQLLKELRRDGCKVPFILFTGKGREEVVIEALNNGADFYLQKGGQPSSQFAELSHMIWISHSRRQAVESTMRSLPPDGRLQSDRERVPHLRPGRPRSAEKDHADNPRVHRFP